MRTLRRYLQYPLRPVCRALHGARWPASNASNLDDHRHLPSLRPISPPVIHFAEIHEQSLIHRNTHHVRLLLQPTRLLRLHRGFCYSDGVVDLGDAILQWLDLSVFSESRCNAHPNKSNVRETRITDRWSSGGCGGSTRNGAAVEALALLTSSKLTAAAVASTKSEKCGLRKITSRISGVCRNSNRPYRMPQELRGRLRWSLIRAHLSPAKRSITAQFVAHRVQFGPSNSG